jgi:hypothetical protein
MKQGMYKNDLIGEVGAPIGAASNTDSNSDRLDMSGYEGVIFIGTVTDSVATGVATFTAEGNTIDSDTGMVAITSAAATKTCTVNDDINDQLLIVEVKNPLKRYIQLVRTSATANIAFGSLIAIRYGAKEKPVTADSTVLNAASVVGS